MFQQPPLVPTAAGPLETLSAGDQGPAAPDQRTRKPWMSGGAGDGGSVRKALGLWRQAGGGLLVKTSGRGGDGADSEVIVTLCHFS
ncbi:unnamed protein product [Boreogadus saida]